MTGSVKMCRNGHPFSADNNYVDSTGTYQCRLCRYNRVKRYRTRKLAKLRGIAL